MALRTRKPRGGHRAPLRRERQEARRPAALHPASRSQQPALGPVSRPASRGPRPASRGALKNWRVRWRLLALVLIPTITAVGAGGIFIASSAQSALVYQRVVTLAN